MGKLVGLKPRFPHQKGLKYSSPYLTAMALISAATFDLSPICSKKTVMDILENTKQQSM
jgi:hypothetical protein